jgi:signal peptidase I
MSECQRTDQVPYYFNEEAVRTLSGPALKGLLEAVLERGMPFRFKAHGFSMIPFVRNGDLITVSPLAGTRPGHGEVVAFIHPGNGKLVVHRVVGGKGSSCLIWGDNSPEADGMTPVTNILGRVTRVERDGKQIYLGLGVERHLIACLTRKGLFWPILRHVWPLVRPIFRFHFGGRGSQRGGLQGD